MIAFKTKPFALAGLFLGLAIAVRPVAGHAESIIDEWSSVKIPPPPELHKVTIDPKTTVLMVMGFVDNSCNATRRPRCAATIPQVAKLLSEARKHGVLIVHSVPTGNPSADNIVKELQALPGEMVIPP